jgi:DNA-binding CsgD family transcriptional regulator
LTKVGQAKPNSPQRQTMTILKDFKHIILYGLTLAILVFALKWLQWKFLIVDNAIEIYIGLVAIFFTALGVWVATQLVKPKIQTVIVEKEIFVPQPENFTINETELQKLNLSIREYEVLQLLTKGHSNADIAQVLFLSLSTIKTHVSNLYFKMDVKSRTQAITKAKQLKIIQ